MAVMTCDVPRIDIITCSPNLDMNLDLEGVAYDNIPMEKVEVASPVLPLTPPQNLPVLPRSPSMPAVITHPLPAYITPPSTIKKSRPSTSPNPAPLIEEGVCDKIDSTAHTPLLPLPGCDVGTEVFVNQVSSSISPNPHATCQETYNLPRSSVAMLPPLATATALSTTIYPSCSSNSRNHDTDDDDIASPEYSRLEPVRNLRITNPDPEQAQPVAPSIQAQPKEWRPTLANKRNAVSPIIKMVRHMPIHQGHMPIHQDHGRRASGSGSGNVSDSLGAPVTPTSCSPASPYRLLSPGTHSPTSPHSTAQTSLSASSPRKNGFVALCEGIKDKEPHLPYRIESPAYSSDPFAELDKLAQGLEQGEYIKQSALRSSKTPPPSPRPLPTPRLEQVHIDTSADHRETLLMNNLIDFADEDGPPLPEKEVMYGMSSPGPQEGALPPLRLTSPFESSRILHDVFGGPPIGHCTAFPAANDQHAMRRSSGNALESVPQLAASHPESLRPRLARSGGSAAHPASPAAVGLYFPSPVTRVGEIQSGTTEEHPSLPQRRVRKGNVLRYHDDTRQRASHDMYCYEPDYYKPRVKEHSGRGRPSPLSPQHQHGQSPSDQQKLQDYPHCQYTIAENGDSSSSPYALTRQAAFDLLAQLAVDDCSPFAMDTASGAVRLGEYKRGFDGLEIARWRDAVYNCPGKLSGFE
ncbi:hypothetical protein EMMF5_002960 [Cystobasidiomycetes sp. EMM_F5]